MSFIHYWDKKRKDLHFEIDGVVNATNAPKLIEAGADALVAGSFVFKSDNPTKTIENLKNC